MLKLEITATLDDLHDVIYCFDMLLPSRNYTSLWERLITAIYGRGNQLLLDAAAHVRRLLRRPNGGASPKAELTWNYQSITFTDPDTKTSLTFSRSALTNMDDYLHLWPVVLIVCIPNDNYWLLADVLAAYGTDAISGLLTCVKFNDIQRTVADLLTWALLKAQNNELADIYHDMHEDATNRLT